MEAGTTLVWLAAAILWSAFLIAVFLRRKGRRDSVEIHARDISGIVVGRDVHGDVIQNNPADQAQTEKRVGFWEYLGRGNLVLGAVAAIATIIAFIMTLTGGSP